MKIKHEDLQGRIKELSEKYNVTMIVYDNLKESLNALEFVDKHFTDVLGCDLESEGLNPVVHKLLGLAIATKGNAGLYFTVRGWSNDDIVTLIHRFNKLKAKKIFHNSIFDSPFTGIRYGVKLQADIDTLIIAHALLTDRQYYEEGLGLKALTESYLPFGSYEDELTDFKNDYCKEHKLKKSEFTYDLIPDSILAPYAIFDVMSTLLLYKKFQKAIAVNIEQGWTRLQEIIDLKHKANKYYIDAKTRGILIDRPMIQKLHKEWDNTRQDTLNKLLSNPNIKKAESIIKRGVLKKAQASRKSLLPLSRCRKLWKENSFNFNSNQHKQILFFDVMGLPVIEKTDSGANGCGAETISHYKDLGLEMFVLLDEYTRVNKGITSFLGTEGEKGLWNLTSDEHPYAHGSHNICGTVSSRTSTDNPNFAQMPSNGVLKSVKKCFKVEEGYKWMSFDFSAEESRMACLEAQEPSMMEAFDSGMDMHCLTAWGVYKNRMELPQYDTFNAEIQEIIATKYKKTYRQQAKIVAFSILYGAQAVGLAKNLKVSKEEAQIVIDAYYTANKKMAKMMEDNKQFLCDNGYFENRFGARVYLRNAKGFNPKSKQRNWKAIEEQRFINNFHIQSSSAFYMYRCMVDFFEEVEQLGLDVSLLMTIYDSFMVRVNNNIETELVAKLFYKHFARRLDGVTMDIEAFMSSDGTWYTYEDVSLAEYKGADFVPIEENYRTGS